MTRNHVWIVEMFNWENGQWRPTGGVRLTKADAILELRDWWFRHPDDKFRITKYERVKP